VLKGWARASRFPKPNGRAEGGRSSLPLASRSDLPCVAFASERRRGHPTALLLRLTVAAALLLSSCPLAPTRALPVGSLRRSRNRQVPSTRWPASAAQGFPELPLAGKGGWASWRAWALAGARRRRGPTCMQRGPHRRRRHRRQPLVHRYQHQQQPPLPQLFLRARTMLPPHRHLLQLEAARTPPRLPRPPRPHRPQRGRCRRLNRRRRLQHRSLRP